MASQIGFKRLYSIQLAIAAIATFAGSFALLYLYQEAGFSYMDLMFAFPAGFLSWGVVVLLAGKHKPFRLLRLGLLVNSLNYLFLVFFVKNLPLLILYNLIQGFYLGLFWLPYDTVYFRMGDKFKTAFHSSIAFLSYPLMNTFMPFIAGSFITATGFRMVFSLASFASLILFVLTGFVRYEHEIDFTFSKMREISRRIRSLLVIEGFWQGVDWIALPLISFYYFTSSLSYGSFLSYIGLTGALASLILCRISDSKGQRRVFAYSSIFMLAALTIISSFTKNELGWTIVRGAVSFTAGVLGPFTVSILLDYVGKAK
ncbi:MAG TPA: hypothetical protein ENN13_01340, partial [Candidatus Altiarchaeales archaeon]|nr:hypothetical protein [Candidatus Altiarchaeales archaeon]